MNLSRLERWLELKDVLHCDSCRQCDRIAFAVTVVWCCIFGAAVTVAAAVLW